MINLLPQSEKKKLQKEFYLRYGVVALLLLLALELIAFFAFVPSYLAISSSTATIKAVIATTKTGTQPGGEETQNDLNVIKAEIALLKGGGPGDTPPSEVMALLFGQKPSGVAISRFSYARTAAGISAQISGNADKPDDLILFRKLLKDDKQHIKDARYAQSFINKKADIDFLLTVDFK